MDEVELPEKEEDTELLREAPKEPLGITEPVTVRLALLLAPAEPELLWVTLEHRVEL